MIRSMNFTFLLRERGSGGADSAELSLRAAEPAPLEPSSLRELRSASLPQGTVRFRGEGCVVSGNLGLSWQVIRSEALQ